MNYFYNKIILKFFGQMALIVKRKQNISRVRYQVLVNECMFPSETCIFEENIAVEESIYRFLTNFGRVLNEKNLTSVEANRLLKF